MSVDPGSRGWNEHRHLPVSIPNVQLAADVARANQLTNGGHEIWQRGAGPFTASGVFASDRWQTNLAGTDTLSISKDTTHQAPGSNACAACTFVLGSGAGATCYLQALKASDGYVFGGQTLSVSHWVNPSVSNAVRIGIYDATNAVWTYSPYAVAGAQTLTVTATLAANCTQIWVAVLFAASCTAYLDNAMLVPGSVAANYVPLPPADDLARCLRYYEVIGGNGASDIILRGWIGANGEALHLPIPFKAQMAVTPSVTKVGTWQVANAGQPSAQAPSTWGFRIDITGTTAGAEAYAYNGVVGEYLTAEANP